MKMIETYYRILKHDPDGNLVKDSGLVQSHSYVIQFLELVKVLLCGVGTIATDVDGVESAIYSGGAISGDGRVDGGVGLDTYGVVVGTNAGTSAEDNEDYALDTKIAHSGVGAAGCLNYQAVTFVPARVVGPNIDLDISRAFLNETGVTITVKEIGIICKTLTKYFLLLRDVVADEPVDDAETLTVVYILRTTA